MKKIVKNGLIVAALSLLLAFTFLFTNSSNKNIKAESLVTYSDKLEEPYQYQYNINYYVDTQSTINLMNSLEKTGYGFSYSAGTSTTRKNFMNLSVNTITDDTGITACIWDNQQNKCIATDNYNFNNTLITGSIYYKYYVSQLYPNLYINGTRTDPNQYNQSILIINNNVYKSSQGKLLLDENNSPTLLGNIDESLIYFKFVEENTSSIPQYFRNPLINSVVQESYIYLNASLPLNPMHDIINITLDGISNIYTIYIPSFITAVVGTISTLFMSNGQGTAVLGILVCICGIAIVTSIFIVALRILKIKRKV